MPVDDKDVDAFMDSFTAMEKAPPPTLPELRMFVVRRLRQAFPGSVVEEIFVTAHFAEYGQGGVLILMAYVIDAAIGKAVTRTVRAFNSWLDVEIVPVPAKSNFAH